MSVTITLNNQIIQGYQPRTRDFLLLLDKIQARAALEMAPSTAPAIVHAAR